MKRTQSKISSLLVLVLSLALPSLGQAQLERLTGPPPQELFFADGFEGGNYFQWSRAELGAADSTAPEIQIVEPSQPLLLNQHTAQITAVFLDSDAGIAPGSLRIDLDGVRLDPDCTVSESSAQCETPLLNVGLHEIGVSVWDRAGNRGGAGVVLEVVIDAQPPTVNLITPTDGALFNTSTIPVTGTVADADAVATVQVNGQAAALVGDSFSASASLVEGSNLIRVDAMDRAGNSAAVAHSVEFDLVPPSLMLSEPSDGAWTNEGSIRFSGTVEDSSASLSVTIAGDLVPTIDGRFEAQVQLLEGPHPILVEAEDGAGNVTSREVLVRRLTVPEIRMISPVDGSLVSEDFIEVSGEISGSTAVVSVNGVVAVVDGGTFTASSVPLDQGGTVLSAVARLPSGAAASAKVSVIRDTEAPRLTVYSPLEGETLLAPAVDVSGLVNDIVLGTVNAAEVTVMVNGVQAAVSNRSFFVPSVPLQAGENVLTLTAEDASGNTANTTVTVFHEPPGLPFIQVEAGNQQEAVIGAVLPNPLRARLLDDEGNPVSGETVVFSVIQGNGTLSGGKRSEVAISDSFGLIEAHFTLGTRVGVGVHRAEAQAIGFAGRAHFVASALPAAPAFVHVDRGGQQRGATGQFLPDPFVVVVTDAGFNRLGDVPVLFEVAKGLGTFATGERFMTVATNEDGRAVLSYRLGTEEGIASEVVTARIPTHQTIAPATFVASAFAAGDPAETSVTGIVLDNVNKPVPGVTVELGGTGLLTQSDEAGLFSIPGAPIGTFLLEVDGATATVPGEWPHLEFELTTIPGRDSSLGMPIYLLPLDRERGVSISPTVGGVLRIPELPGFSLEIAPGSVTFPDGTQTGTVSATLVHSDKIPMVPNFGQQPTFIVTIQPAGAAFDPPAAITLPNTDGLVPGTVTELYSFDHDLGAFVSIGTGSVSDDGTIVSSDPGVGILKAGWHCGGNPTSTGTPHDCPTCQECDGATCLPADGRSCQHPDRCKVNDRCEGGDCVGDQRQLLALEALANGSRFVEVFVGDQITFAADYEHVGCPEEEVEFNWEFGDGSVGEGKTTVHRYLSEGLKVHRVSANCDEGCSEKTGFGTVNVKCPEVRITGKEHDFPLCANCEVEIYAETEPEGLPVDWRIPPGTGLGGQVSLAGRGTTADFLVFDPGQQGIVPVIAYDPGAPPACLDQAEDETSVFVFVPDEEPLLNLGRWRIRRGEIRAAIATGDAQCIAALLAGPALVAPVADQFFLREDGHPDCSATDNTARNAFVHAWLNCHAAAQCGRSIAKRFWDGHENYPNAVCNAAYLDFHNNDVGRDVAVFQDPLSCSDRVLGALHDGRLRWKSDPNDNTQCPGVGTEETMPPQDACYVGPAP